MISIVTPSYGQLDWLRLAAASVADQQGPEIEHIVQDAGTPGVEKIFRTESQFRSARLFVEKDAGMYDAINRGLSRATGEICAYLNCDEQYLPDAVAQVEEFFRKHPAVDVLFGDVILVNEKGSPLSYRRAVPPSLHHVRLSHLNTNSCAMFFRRGLVERGFLFDTKWKAIGDVAWVHALLENKIQMDTLPVALAVFTFTGKNLGNTPLSTNELARFREGARFPGIAGPAAVLLHRLRKLFAGAYRPRSVDFEIYTLASPRQRQRQRKVNVGYSWPGISEDQS